MREHQPRKGRQDDYSIEPGWKRASFPLVSIVVFLLLSAIPALAESSAGTRSKVEGRVREVVGNVLSRVNRPCIGWMSSSIPTVAVVGAYRRKDDFQEARLRLILSAVNNWFSRRENEYKHLPVTEPLELSSGDSDKRIALQLSNTFQANPPEIMLFVELGLPAGEGNYRLDLIAIPYLKRERRECWSGLWINVELPYTIRIQALDRRNPRPLTVSEVAAELEALKFGSRNLSQPFRECDNCPVMMAIPGGMFFMGSPPRETGHRMDENGPQGKPLKVTIDKPFAIGMYEVTLGEFKKFTDETGRPVQGSCSVLTNGSWDLEREATFKRHNFNQKDNEPVVCVSWNDAIDFVSWVNTKTKIKGNPYRLPTEAEWEYAARGRPMSKGIAQQVYWWGNTPDHLKANFAEGNARPYKTDDDYWSATAPKNLFRLNPFGLAHMLGNVSEWVQDCWSPDHVDAPTDGSKLPDEKCSQRTQRVVRGGSWRDSGNLVRSASRTHYSPDTRRDYVGFRLARTLSPPPE